MHETYQLPTTSSAGPPHDHTHPRHSHIRPRHSRTHPRHSREGGNLHLPASHLTKQNSRTTLEL